MIDRPSLMCRDKGCCPEASARLHARTQRAERCQVIRAVPLGPSSEIPHGPTALPITCNSPVDHHAACNQLPVLLLRLLAMALTRASLTCPMCCSNLQLLQGVWC